MKRLGVLLAFASVVWIASGCTVKEEVTPGTSTNTVIKEKESVPVVTPAPPTTTTTTTTG